jgi:hypothetical protein
MHKRWSDNVGLEIATTMHYIVLAITKFYVHEVRCIAISWDEVRMINNQIWASVYTYFIESFKCMYRYH